MRYHSLGDVPAKRHAQTRRDGKLPVNLSGGAISLNPVYCTGLIRIAEIALQVLGKAGPHQRENTSTGLAHAASGDAMQYNTVVVLRAGQKGAQA